MLAGATSDRHPSHELRGSFFRGHKHVHGGGAGGGQASVGAEQEPLACSIRHFASAVSSCLSARPHRQMEPLNQLSTHPQGPPVGVRSLCPGGAPRAPYGYAPKGVSVLLLTSACSLCPSGCGAAGAPPCAGGGSATECDFDFLSPRQSDGGRAPLARDEIGSAPMDVSLPAVVCRMPMPVRVHAQRASTHASRGARSTRARDAHARRASRSFFCAREACITASANVNCGDSVPCSSQPAGWRGASRSRTHREWRASARERGRTLTCAAHRRTAITCVAPRAPRHVN